MNRLVWVVAALACWLLAGCSLGPDFYPKPPDNPDLPRGQDVKSMSILLTTDDTNRVLRASSTSMPEGVEPRDLDVEVLVTERLARKIDTFQFTRDFSPGGISTETGAKVVARHFSYHSWGREEMTTIGGVRGSAPNQVAGSEFREWTNITYDDSGWRFRIRLRFESDHPDWEVSNSALIANFKDGREQTVLLFDRP